MPAAICIMASVMMKEGMPMSVRPSALTRPSRAHSASAKRIAPQPGSGTLAILTYDSCTVKKATAMPVTLAMLAIDRSISAQRMTKVRPTAIMPVTETWVRMLPTLSRVAKDGLATAKKLEKKDQRQKRRNVAHLRAQQCGDPV